MDLHHMEGAKEHDIAALITRVTLAPTVRNAERLLAEAKKCIPLCRELSPATACGRIVG